MSDSLLDTALKTQHQGQWQASLSLLTEHLSVQPNDLAALQAMAMALAQTGRCQEALPWQQRALSQAPRSPAIHNNLANIYRALGDWDKAKQHYHATLNLAPQHTQALNNLGALAYRQGQYLAAQSLFEKALRIDPDYLDAHYNLGNTYTKLDRWIDAKTHYEWLCQQHPEHLGAQHNLGMTLICLGDYEQALAPLKIAMQRDTLKQDARFHFAFSLAAMGASQAAIEHYLLVLNVVPDHASAAHNLASLYLENNQQDLAKQWYARALELNPHNATALHLYRALSDDYAARAPTGYVKDLFDQYAKHYNIHMKQQLDYQVPALMREMLRDWADARGPVRNDIVDLGCGTGLCAPYLSDLATKLIGIDVSENMIQVAKQQGGYYRLHVGDILTVLPQLTAPFDLAVAADVLVYFGDLLPLFQTVHQALSPDGAWIFSFETLPTAQPPIKLQPSGRYAHHIDHVQEQLYAAGFDISAQQQVTLRQQNQMPCQGAIILAKKV